MMFGLFKTKKLEIISPVSGEIVDLESVSDEVFSQKMVGDGVAVTPTDGIFRAPVDGILSKLFGTHHAYIVRHQSGVEVMVHIGLDTVDLKGEGFRALANEGDEVKAGDPVIEADLERIALLGKETVTPVIVSEMGGFKTLEKKSGNLSQSETVMELK
jgi:glucose-specific phosphotransferase system IIA component